MSGSGRLKYRLIAFDTRMIVVAGQMKTGGNSSLIRQRPLYVEPRRFLLRMPMTSSGKARASETPATGYFTE